jgi:cell division septation protein DedD
LSSIIVASGADFEEGDIFLKDGPSESLECRPHGLVMASIYRAIAAPMNYGPDSDGSTMLGIPSRTIVGVLSMRLTLQRGAAAIAVIAGLGAATMAGGPFARAGETEARAAMQSGDYSKAILELQPLAEQGSPTAEYLLAEIYFGGHGGNLQEALKWMTASADQGYAQAQARLGIIYATGRGVPIDNVQAFRWFSLAAKLADPKTKLKTISETNRSAIAKRLTAAQRAEAEAEVAAWKPNGAPVIASPAKSEGVIGQLGRVIPGIRIQLAAVKNADEAPAEWARLQKSLGMQLDGLVLTVESVDLGTKGIYHRVQAGPFSDKAAAAAKCEAIKAMKQDCLVVVRK